MARIICLSAVLLLAEWAGPARSAEPERSKAANPGKVVPPKTGIYLGQTTFGEGELALLERAIGKKVAVVVDPLLVRGVEEVSEGKLSFNVERAREYWQRGYVIAVGAYEAYPGHKPFTVDRLIRGEYDKALAELASQFRAFGKPMFFMTAREPNGVLWRYLGGFGPKGDRSVEWAFENKKGFAEFIPPSGPPGNRDLFAGLGQADQNDGIERLAAAQRYYHDFFVRRHALAQLTFESMGWAVGPPAKVDDPPDPREQHERRLMAKARFEDLYRLIRDCTDWVSINWYVDTHPREEPGEPRTVRPMSAFMKSMGAFLTELERIAPGKPVLLTELGFPSPRAEAKMKEGMRLLLTHENVKAAVFWVDNDIPCQVRPGTREARALREMIETMPSKFHSEATFSHGAKLRPKGKEDRSKKGP